MRKESEEDKQRAVAHAIATKIHNVELACQKADKQCHDDFEAERKRLKQEHAAEVSLVKKKQWVSIDQEHYIIIMLLCVLQFTSCCYYSCAFCWVVFS